MAGNNIADAVIRIPTSIKGNFFRIWLEFLRPIHHLTNKQLEVGAFLLQERHYFSRKIIDDEDLIDENTFSERTKANIRKTLNINSSHLQVIFSQLKKKKLIVEDSNTGKMRVNPRFIPQVPEDRNNFKFMLYFELDES